MNLHRYLVTTDHVKPEMMTDQGGEVGIFILNMLYPDFDTLDQGPPAAKMMGPEELGEFSEPELV